MLTINIDQMLAETQAHIAADAVRQGTYWNGSHGCFIGCLAHSDRAETLTERFGLPLVLVRICEGIFEGLPADEAREFFSAVPVAIGRDGCDLSLVHWAFLAAELRALPPAPADVQAVIDPVIAGMDLLASGGTWDKAAAEAAAQAAEAAARAAEASAAWDAEAAAWAAAWATRATVAAAWAAEAAARAAARAAAWAAAWAARATRATEAAAWAAMAASRAAGYRRQRGAILRLIRGAAITSPAEKAPDTGATE